MVYRTRFNKGEANRDLQISLPEPGLYTLSMSAINLGGDLTVDWHVADEE